MYIHDVDIRNSEIDAHVWSEISNLTCSRNLFGPTVVTNFNLEKQLFSFKRAQRVLSYHLIYVPWVPYLFSRIMSLGTCHHGMYIARCMVPCLMDHDTLGQTRCALEVLGKLVRLSLSETLTLLALTLMEIDMVKGQKLCFSTHFSHEIP